jgi:hypothetical protein
MSARAGVDGSSIAGFGQREGGGAVRDLEKEGQTAGIGERSRSKFSLLSTSEGGVRAYKPSPNQFGSRRKRFQPSFKAHFCPACPDTVFGP